LADSRGLARPIHPPARMIPANTTGTDDSSLSTQAGQEVEGGIVTTSTDLATPTCKKV
jgi:hypothetical protein